MTHDQRGAILGCSLLFFVVGLILGHIMTSDIYKIEALKAGVGYYDRQTGTFKYGIMDEASTK